jgi:Methylase involved in ubiquinone/menaquinone biosynthesis
VNNYETTVKRWSESAENFNKSVQSQLFDENSVTIWTNLIKENAPQKETVNVLDIGTGPGFFAIILAKIGYQVTGIDCTPEMIDSAVQNAKQQGVNPEFKVMDSHDLDFDDNSFDLIVNRNVTWTLYNPEKAYAEWKRVLKPGGKLLIFDANWYMSHFDEEIGAEMTEGMRAYREKYGELPEKFSMNVVEDYWLKLPMVGVQRPQWDKAALWKLGFQNLVFDTNLSDRVSLTDMDRMLYGCTPMFMISATKATKAEEEEAFNRVYWEGVAINWGSNCLRDHHSFKKRAYLELLEPHLSEEEKYKILDIGTGSGFMATLLAEKGHQLTGVDFSQKMLDEAAYCAQELGVQVEFVRARADHLPFADNSFDGIICRNVTWLMKDLQQAFSEWNRVLKKDGKLIYIDGNWNLYQYDDEERERFIRNRKELEALGEKKLYGYGHSSTVLIDKISANLPFSKIRRPEWDQENLSQFGFNVLAVENNISQKVLTENEQKREATTPMFMVVAQKNN